MFKLVTSITEKKVLENAAIVFFNISLFLSIIYFIIRFIDNIYFAKPNIGDEWFFYRDFSNYLIDGYYDSVLNGISIPLMLATKLIYSFTLDISSSLRLSNSVMVILMFIYLFKRNNLINEKDKHFFLFFLSLLIGTAGGMFYGTNDSFYSLGLLIILCESYLFHKDNTHSQLLLLLSFTLCILSRPHWVINIPIILLCCMIINIIKNKWSVNLIYQPIIITFIASLVLALLFNYPKLIENNFSNNQNEYLPKFLFLSYADKSNTYKTDDSDFNWIQWHYYSQMIASNKPYGFFSPMVDWDEVKLYKDLHGESSLPKSYIQYVLEYPIEVIKRVPIALLETSLMSIRYLGFFLFLLPLLIYLRYKERGLQIEALFIPIIVFLTILIFAILLPRMLDNRWFSPIYILTLIFIFDQSKYLKSVLKNNLLILNMFLMDIITIWALWKWKIFLHI